jgi:hypothetical protein
MVVTVFYLKMSDLFTLNLDFLLDFFGAIHKNFDILLLSLATSTLVKVKNIESGKQFLIFVDSPFSFPRIESKILEVFDEFDRFKFNQLTSETTFSIIGANSILSINEKDANHKIGLLKALKINYKVLLS